MSKWEYTTLDKLGNIIVGNPLLRKLDESFSSFTDCAIPLIGYKEINESNLYISKCYQHLSRMGAFEIKELPEGAVCFTVRGHTAGNSAISSFKSACLQHSTYSISPFEGVSESKFIKYSFDFPKLKNKIRSLCRNELGMNQLNNLSNESFNQIKFPNPPIEVQEKIGYILSSYDQLIENNKNQISLLEEIRKSLFKKWFIKLNFTNKESYIFNNSIPNGWRKVQLGDISQLHKGQKSVKSNNIEKIGEKGEYPFFSPSIISRKSLTYSFDLFAILVSTTFSFGSVFVTKIYQGKFEANELMIIIELQDYSQIYIVFEFLKNIYLPRLNRLTLNETSTKTLKIEDLLELEILIPDEKTLEEFNSFWKDIQSKMDRLNEKIKSITKIKKFLLNNLFSEKILIK